MVDLITSEKENKKFGSLRNSKTRSPITTEKRNSLPNPAVLVSGRGLEVSWIEPEKLKKEKKINQGAYAKVYHGSYDGKEIAIKTLLGEVTSTHINSFISEFEILWFIFHRFEFF